MVNPSQAKDADLPVLLATVVILAIILIASMAGISPQLYWDVDPRSLQSDTILGLGPLGAAWLGVLGVLASGVALHLHALAGGRLAWKTSLLALAGLLVCLFHLPGDGPGAITLCAWMGGVAMAVALFHLAQHSRARAIIIAALAAMAIPWTLKSLVYVFVDHPNTVAMFLADEARFVTARGWEMGSPQHLLYKRRMMFPDVTGAYGLSNVYGSIMAAIGIISASLGAGMLLLGKRRMLWLPGVLFGCSVVTLYFTYSKGAALAMLMGLGMLGAVMLAWRFKAAARIAAPLAMLALTAVIALVLVRGAMGPPETAQGERSLLFRYHYWQASVDMLIHEPWERKFLGIGVGDYKQTYSRYKNPLNPEEVTSSHNVFVDDLAMLGIVGGGAWCALLLAWLWMGSRGAAAAMAKLRDDAPAVGVIQHDAGRDRLALQCVGLLAGLIFLYAFAVQWQTMIIAEQFLSWALGAAGFVGMATLLVRWFWQDERLSCLSAMALLPAGAMLLFHGQIEMTFFNLQAAPLALGIVAAAAGAASENWQGAHGSQAAPQGGPQREGQPRWPCVAGAAALVLLGVAMFMLYVAPLTRQQGHLAAAAQQLRKNQFVQAIGSLGKAIEAIPSDARPYESRTMLQVEAFMGLMQQGHVAPARMYLQQAVKTLDDAQAAGVDDAGLLRLRARLMEMAGQQLHEAHFTQEALALWQRVMARSPYSLQDCLHVAELLDASGDAQAATRWYKRAMWIHRWSYLDPARQMSDTQLARVRQRLEAGAPASQPAAP